MRGTFAKTLTELAAADSRILLLTGDLGYMALEPFSERFPDRFFNVGVAEQNMIGLATGLAEAGFIPFVYSIVPFAVLRPYEFIRNGPIHHQLPVRIVGVGGGVEYGHNGPSHYGIEDIGVLRVQPGITLVAPADFEQTRTALHATWDRPGPVYYRLGKDDTTIIPGLQGRFAPGRAQLIREGDDLVIISMGSVTTEVVAAADMLAAQGVSCAIMVVASVSPAPVDDLAQILSHYPLAMTVEAHYVVGGLGSLVCEVVAERGIGCRVVRCGIKALKEGVSGSQTYLHNAYGLSPTQLTKQVLQMLYEVER